MHTFVVICLIAAAISFAAEVFGLRSRIPLVALGLLFATLSVLVPTINP